MKFVIEGTTEELKAFFGEGALVRFISKGELEEEGDCTEEISEADMAKIKCLNTVADALTKFIAEKSS